MMDYDPETFMGDESNSSVIGYLPVGHYPAPVSTRSKPRRAGADTEALPLSIVANWPLLQKAGLSVSANNRIFQFASAPVGWAGLRGSPLSSRSLSRFLEFWIRIKRNWDEPELALSHTGRIQAEWHDGWKRHVELQFGENGDIFYAAFWGKHRHEGKGNTTQVQALLRTLQPD